MGKSTISMAIFNSKLLNYQRVYKKSSADLDLAAAHRSAPGACIVRLQQASLSFTWHPNNGTIFRFPVSGGFASGENNIKTAKK